jgi:hypothetical protein
VPRSSRRNYFASEQSLGPCCRHRAGESFPFRSQHTSAQVGDAVVPTAFIIERRVGTLIRLLNESCGQHSLKTTVQRPWAKSQGTVCISRHFLHDGVAVAFAF